MRIGNGYDVHRLAAERPLIVGGVEIPFEKGLLGHSDADVLCHAICDALLSAAAQGDIGLHFPDSDERYRGISSLLLLKETAAIIARSGYFIGNISAVIIAQAPKFSPHIEKMRVNIANALGLEPSEVGITATTTEKTGPEGRGECISCQAYCLIE